MFSFSEIKFWPGAIDFCDKNNANGQYFSSTRGNKKNFRKKNLTGHRLSGLVLGMVKKNLNKKVGCALIAAGLLAASSVQGSSTSERDFSTSPQTVAETIQREAVLWNWSQWEGHTRAEVWFPRGYRIVFEQYDENGEKDPTIFLLPNGDMTSLSELRARNFPGFTLSDFNSVKVLAPERIKPCYWFHGVISLCPPEYKFRFTNGGLRAQLNDGPWEMIPCIRRR